MKRTVLAVSLVVAALGAQAAEVGGVKLEDRLRLSPGGPELVLNGAGIRTRAIFKVYVGGLYLAEKKGTPAEVLALAGPKRVSMTMLRDLGAQQLSEALADGIRNNSSAGEQDALKARIDELLGIMNALGEAKKGDAILLDYLPDSGTRVIVNGQPRGKPIAGEDFYRALLKIWLGDKPVDGDLKKGMLGQPG
jgi:Chalcone isomerase-like